MDDEPAWIGRLPGLRYETIDATQRALWDKLLRPPRGRGVVSGEGLLQGPYNAMVTAPAVGERLADLGEQLRFHTSLAPRLTELAIVTVAVHYRAEVEWWAHSRLALEAGVSEDVIERIGAGNPEEFEPRIDWLVSSVARQLTTTGRIDPGLYAEVRESLGETALVELVSLIGFYVIISFVLNGFDVPLPPGVSPRWT
jgi:4-carboxymuconolactone decarboxylase